MNKGLLAVFMISVFFFSIVYVIVVDTEDAEAKRRKACGRDYCVDRSGDCLDYYCHFRGNGLGVGCRVKNMPSGSSCGGDGICKGGSCFSNAPPSVSVSGSSSVELFDAGKFTVTSDHVDWKSTNNIKFFVDGSQIDQCSPSGSGSSITCTHTCTQYCGDGKRRKCCSGFTTCGSTGGNAKATCNFEFSPDSEKTYSYYATATDSSSKVGTSSTKTFEGTATCNSNGICESGESSVSCSSDCDATCTDNGVCEIRESLACADCGSCNKDGICDAGETAGVCPADCSDFNITIDPVDGVANIDDVKDVNVSLTSTTTVPVSLSAEGLPLDTVATFSPTSCGGDCYSNASIDTSNTTPTGTHSITIRGTLGSLEKTQTYSLEIIPDSCNSNSVCEYPETQSSCSNDCNTTALIPSPVSPGDPVTVTVEFYDFRYEEDDKVKIDMIINPEGTAWVPSNGCFFGGKKMGAVADSDGTIAWPAGTTSEDGHLRISTTCTLPSSISAGSHTLIATPTIF